MWLDPAEFPNATDKSVIKTSPDDKRYNCVAWAVGDSTIWWEPRGGYWPRRLPENATLSAYVSMFHNQGFVVRPTHDADLSVKVIAIYAVGDRFTHVARKLSNGRWTSKMGKDFDVEHELTALEGPEYGTVAIFMQRSQTP